MATLSLAVIQHHPAEGPGRIQDWCKNHGHTLTCFMAPADVLPKLTDFDGLIILGGPTDVVENPPWMQAELNLITDAININMPILAICLGAQLLATALGARVYPLEKPELGWLEIELTKEAVTANKLVVPQWHFYGFDFSQPEQEKRMIDPVSIEARSALCEQQIFRHQRQLGLQFHPEWDDTQILQLIESFNDECPFTTEIVQAKPCGEMSKLQLQQQLLAMWFMPLLDSIFKPNYS
ncbi:type 1 glutamine amidotransferase [Shewanella donghaensis]|uniref:type 1 glutamine amidotransferase n=1 Tax=Shewanella donghaensis TaxID=238836 RepID=UPI001182D708|nr:type 1 glutamine amidotransferase [Shewanella donghaensis]